MMEPEILDDDARFHHRATLVHEHGDALERPQGCVLGRQAVVTGASVRNSNGVSFSYSAISTF
jgi:hypothetical protein